MPTRMLTATVLGKQLDQYHQYKLYYSIDGKKWNVLVDKSNNKTDVPHDYVELANLCRHDISNWKTFTCHRKICVKRVAGIWKW